MCLTPTNRRPPIPLTYHANGGAFDDGSDTLEVKDLSGTYQLTDKAPTHDSVDLDGTSVPVLFIGWMTEDDSAKIYSGNDTAPNTVTSVAMDEDKEVWAAWSYDEDGNGEPDVTETQYTVTARVEGEGRLHRPDQQDCKRRRECGVHHRRRGRLRPGLHHRQ